MRRLVWLLALAVVLAPLAVCAQPKAPAAVKGPATRALILGSVLPYSRSMESILRQQAAWLVLTIVATLFVDRAASARLADRGS